MIDILAVSEILFGSCQNTTTSCSYNLHKIRRKAPVAETFYRDSGQYSQTSLKRNSNTYYLRGAFVIFSEQLIS